ncbi:MAG: hypothetical protein ACRC8A_19020 [Microcoleaceae cyanobacterium]
MLTQPGLHRANFRKICINGFGDGNNAYAHSMAWFKDHLYVGTTRANLCLLRHSMKKITIDTWPVECPYPVYSSEFEQIQARAEIWRYSLVLDSWERVFQAPMVFGNTGEEMSRDLGYRGMVVFQGKSDPEPALYISTWSRSRGDGPLILRSEDGKTFDTVSKPGLVGLPVTSFRTLVPFKGRLFTAPSGAAKGNPNTAGVTMIYESDDPAQGQWRPINEPNFGDPDNSTVFEMKGFGDYLYAGTFNIQGFQIWRTRAEGSLPYHWERVMDRGGDRGCLNQIATSMMVFNDALYVGSGIQNGGYDRLNQIGPAGVEILRIQADGSWDVIMGNIRPNGKRPISGYPPGFGNLCNGYLWRMGVHEGWLYAATMDWSIFLRYVNLANKPPRTMRLLQRVGLETIMHNQAGFELWRTADGENWVPVDCRGFGNPYNYGVRNIISTPHGVFLGTTNPFGPKVAVPQGEAWHYVDNPQGGLEVWLGSTNVNPER